MVDFSSMCRLLFLFTHQLSVDIEQRVACDSFAPWRCCLQLTSTPRDAHPARRAF